MNYFMEDVKEIKPGVKLIVKVNNYPIPIGYEVELAYPIKEGDTTAIVEYNSNHKSLIRLWSVDVEYNTSESRIYPCGSVCRLTRDVIFPNGRILKKDEEMYTIQGHEFDLCRSVIATISPLHKTDVYYVLTDAIIPVSLIEESFLLSLQECDSNKSKSLTESRTESSAKNDIIDDKLRWDLLPMEEIEDIVKVYHAGAKKYSPNSWQNLPNGFERYRAAMFRHLMEYMKGNKIDSDTGCMHLAQVCWNAIAMLWYDKHGKGLISNDKEGRVNN